MPILAKGTGMETTEKERIRQTVRETYGRIAAGGDDVTGQKPAVSCCAPTDDPVQIGEAASCDCGCCPADLGAEEMTAIMGYSQEDVVSVPEGANLGLGCGNPVALASLRSGETVVDLGSGGGFDCFLAGKEVGKDGKVIGVDMTPEMISKARGNAEKARAVNVEFRLGEIEHLPVADNSADIVMSNCVINLSPDKISVYQDAYRVLKPGGRVAISDVVATAELPDKVREDLALVAACIGGAATIDETKAMLRAAGFRDIKVEPNDRSRELLRQWDPGKSENAGDYIVSAYIEGVKPS